MKLHLLRRKHEQRRGGCRPHRAAPPRRIIQSPPFSKQNHFSNILFRVEYESGLSFFKEVSVWPRSRFEVTKFLPLFFLGSVLALLRAWIRFRFGFVCCCCCVWWWIRKSNWTMVCEGLIFYEYCCDCEFLEKKNYCSWWLLIFFYIWFSELGKEKKLGFVNWFVRLLQFLFLGSVKKWQSIYRLSPLGFSGTL